MFTRVNINHCHAGESRAKTSLLSLVFVLAGAVGFFAYTSAGGGGMLVRGSANSVETVELTPGTYRGGVVRPREVQLHAAGKCIGAGGNFIVPNVPLLLQHCNGSRGQIFALDGDSIIFANERSFIVEVRNARSQNGTPL